MSLFEVISKEEYESENVTPVRDMPRPRNVASGVGNDPGTGVTKVWCEFCKGWYIEEYHFGEEDE